ncbi:hypothetical protein N1031_06850 [Herbiconiux moechotypicola]|uniref:Uncharacterized protein n=1 Tax=Herbiconiux moechotypicola TaxID=637393 RepID=A0ABN3DFV9_9MICO|nr:hypothetical protein [Herbiconiux moechotypicola]MCS5729475.1 hypothetical protein [Herbiconiux moechotypicola]
MVTKKRYSGRDSVKWSVKTYAGEILARLRNGAPQKFDGFATANAVARQLGGVAVRD